MNDNYSHLYIIIQFEIFWSRIFFYHYENHRFLIHPLYVQSQPTTLSCTNKPITFLVITLMWQMQLFLSYLCRLWFCLISYIPIGHIIFYNNFLTIPNKIQSQMSSKTMTFVLKHGSKNGNYIKEIGHHGIVCNLVILVLC